MGVRLLDVDGLGMVGYLHPTALFGDSVTMNEHALDASVWLGRL